MGPVAPLAPVVTAGESLSGLLSIVIADMVELDSHWSELSVALG